MKSVKVTAAAIKKNGCYLVALRRLEDRNGGTWEFPGGKIESGETPEACLKREIQEELGIEIEIQGFLTSSRHEQEGTEIEIMAYQATWLCGDLRPREHAALRWIEPACFDEILLSPADVAIARFIQTMERTQPE